MTPEEMEERIAELEEQMTEANGFIAYFEVWLVKRGYMTEEESRQMNRYIKDRMEREKKTTKEIDEAMK